MIINGSDPTGYNAFTVSLFQLTLKNIVAAIALRCISLECIIILLWVIVSEQIKSKYQPGISSEFTVTDLNQVACPVMGPSVVNKKYSHFSKSTRS